VTPRLRLRTRLRRRSSPALTRRALPLSSLASRTPLVLTGRLPPLASPVPLALLPLPAGTVLLVRSGVLLPLTPSGLPPPRPPRSLSGRVLRPRRVLALRVLRLLRLIGKQNKKEDTTKFKESEFDTRSWNGRTEKALTDVWMWFNQTIRQTFAVSPFPLILLRQNIITC
jgi:hypothetical protein